MKETVKDQTESNSISSECLLSAGLQDLTWSSLGALEQKEMHEIPCSIRQFFRTNFAFLVSRPWRYVSQKSSQRRLKGFWEFSTSVSMEGEDSSGIHVLPDVIRREGTVKLEGR